MKLELHVVSEASILIHRDFKNRSRPAERNDNESRFEKENEDVMFSVRTFEIKNFTAFVKE